MDPLSIAAGAAGFAALAIQISDKVSKCISNWKSFYEDVQHLNHYIQQLRKTLDKLDASIRDCHLSPDAVTAVEDDITECRMSLDNLNEELAEANLLIARRSKAKLQIQRAINALGDGKKKKLEAICETLKSHLGFALSVLIL